MRIVAKVLRIAVELFHFVGTCLGQVTGPMMALVQLLFELLYMVRKIVVALIVSVSR